MHTHTHNVAEVTSLPENRDLLVHSAQCWRIHRWSQPHRPAGEPGPCPVSLLRLLCPVSALSPLLGPALLASPVTARRWVTQRLPSPIGRTRSSRWPGSAELLAPSQAFAPGSLCRRLPTAPSATPEYLLLGPGGGRCNAS